MKSTCPKTTLITIREAAFGKHLASVRYNGHVWTVRISLNGKRAYLTRIVNVKGRLELGGHTANHSRAVTIERPLDVLVEALAE